MQRITSIPRALLVASLLTLSLTACAGSGTDGVSDPDDDLAAAERDDGDVDVDDGDADSRAAAHAAEIQAELGLDDEQTAEVEGILVGTHERLRELHERGRALHDGGADEQQMREIKEEARLIFEEHDERMRNVLTQEQYAAYETYRDEHRKRGKPCMYGKHGKHGKHAMYSKHGKHGDHPMDPTAIAEKLQSKLGLDDDQRKKVEAVLVAQQDQMKALGERGRTIHEGMKSAHESGDEAAIEAKRGEMQALRQDHGKLIEAQADKLRPILNDEQFEAYQELMREHRRAKGPHGPHHRGPHHGPGHGSGHADAG